MTTTNPLEPQALIENQPEWGTPFVYSSDLVPSEYHLLTTHKPIYRLRSTPCYYYIILNMYTYFNYP